MTILTDTIGEYTSAAGVTIDGVLLKDGLVDGVDMADLADIASISPSAGDLIGDSSGWTAVTPSAAPGATADVILKTGAGGKLQLEQLGIGIDPTADLHVMGSNGLILAQNSASDAAAKSARFGGGHYTNAEEYVMGMIVTSASGTSLVSIGGGSSVANAATAVRIYAAADTTTTTGTRHIYIDVNGVAIGEELATNANCQLKITPSSAAKAALRLQGAASQTGPLLEILNSAAQTRFEISQEGIFTFKGTMGNSTKTVGTDAPADWVQIVIGTTTYYLPAYAA